MTTENALPWAEEADCAVTVCDTEGVILYMNEKARATFAQHGDLIGRKLFDCHNERSRETIRRMLASGGTNAYTIEKQGVRKMTTRRRGGSAAKSAGWWKSRWSCRTKCRTT